jgi:MFS family permease
MAFLHQSENLTKAQFSAWLSAFVGWIFDYYEVFLMTFLIVPIGTEFSLEPGQTSYIISVQLLFLAVGGVLFGFLADRYGRQRILMWTIITYSVFTLARAFAPNYLSLLVLTAIAALGIGGEFGVGQTLISEVMPSRRRGWWSGLYYGGIYFGIMAAALVGGYVAPAIGWRWTFVLSGLPVLLAVFVRYAAPESDVWTARQRTTGIQWGTDVLRRSFILPFLICLVAGILQFFAYYGITTYLPTYLTSEGFTISQAGWWLFFTAVAGLVGSLAGAYTNDRWGRRITLTYLASSSAIGGYVLAAMWNSFLGSLWILVPLFVLYFGSNGATVFGALFSEQFPTDVRSSGVSWALQIARGLAFLPPIIAAAVFPVYGYVPVILGGATLFGLLALWAWVFRETRGTDIGEIDSEVENRWDREAAASEGSASRNRLT